MKAHISIRTVEELEEEAADAIVIHEDPPDGACPEDEDDPYLGEEGTLVVDTEELEVEADFVPDDFPETLSFPVRFAGWDDTEERMASVHGLETHLPAQVTITLVRKWSSDSGTSIAVYRVEAIHGG